MKIKCLFALLLISSLSVSAQKYFVKHVKFPAHATAEQKLDMASRLVPTSQQLEWQQMELTAFLHFGINTFTGHEWGSGKEDPKLFNPEKLDCDQWVSNLKAAGFKMAILTAKHHDGFCLWPTKTTKHSVASSPWKEGKGDVVYELREACKKYGLKFGVYLSPWDRNAECYGDSPAYNKFFIEQLTELLTNYGEVHEVWFDGACGEGPNGKKQEYDWEAIEKTIRRLQPKAVTAIMGDDVRWVGNEKVSDARLNGVPQYLLRVSTFARKNKIKLWALLVNQKIWVEETWLFVLMNSSGIPRKWMCQFARDGSIMLLRIIK